MWSVAPQVGGIPLATSRVFSLLAILPSNRQRCSHNQAIPTISRLQYLKKKIINDGKQNVPN